MKKLSSEIENTVLDNKSIRGNTIFSISALSQKKRKCYVGVWIQGKSFYFNLKKFESKKLYLLKINAYFLSMKHYFRKNAVCSMSGL